MSNFSTLKYRRSTEVFEPNKWFVYHDFGKGKMTLVKECENEAEARELHRSMLMEEIEATILSIDNSQDVSHEFLEQCLDDEICLGTSVESFFNDCCFDISQLKPLKGEVESFHDEVAKLQRPYVAISDIDQQSLIDGKADYYLSSGGKVVTFGKASVAGGNTEFALMPLNYEEAQKVLSQQ